jgi:hypothetical protein
MVKRTMKKGGKTYRFFGTFISKKQAKGFVKRGRLADEIVGAPKLEHLITKSPTGWGDRAIVWWRKK